MVAGQVPWRVPKAARAGAAGRPFALAVAAERPAGEPRRHRVQRLAVVAGRRAQEQWLLRPRMELLLHQRRRALWHKGRCR
jgi:hypothetical protein